MKRKAKQAACMSAGLGTKAAARVLSALNCLFGQHRSQEFPHTFDSKHRSDLCIPDIFASTLVLCEAS